MKYKVTPEEFEKFSDDFKKEYEKGSGDNEGNYVLKVEGGEDVGAALRARDYEKENAKKAKARVKELESEMEELQNEITEIRTKSPDVKSLESSWQSKYNKLKEEKENAEKTLAGEITRILVDDTSVSLAKALSDTPDVLVPHIKARLSTEFEGGKAKLRVKDLEGNPSALTLDELANEFRSNKNFAPVLKGSEGSGSGANGGQGGDGGKNTGKKPDYTTASTKEIAAYRKQQRESNSAQA